MKYSTKIMLSMGFLPTMLSAESKPNFVVVLLDDVGFADFSCYGGAIPTPNIDAIANKGVRMSQMYNCARSCPTRASLLTGLYPQQAGIGYMTGNNRNVFQEDSYQGFLNDECVTIAEAVGNQGYFTAMTGKWHVGAKQGQTPSNRGFQRSLSATAGGFYYPESKKAKLFLDGKQVQSGTNGVPEKYYSTDLWTDFSLQFLDEARAEKKPYMLYLAYNAAHFPLQAPEDEIAAFKGKFSQGWDVMRQEVYQRQLDMNLLGAEYPLTPRNPLIPFWEDLSAEDRARCEHTMEIFAATIKKVDDNIGRLVRDIKDNGEWDNTVFILLTDNGGNAEGRDVFGTYAGKKPGSVESVVFLGQAWAEVSNTPFYLYKHHKYEGGITTPCVVSYPNGISEENNGKVVHEPAHVIDIMATLMAVTESEYPKTFKGNNIKPMQGENLLPIWQGKKIKRSEPIFWEHENNRAMRDGDWKIVKENKEQDFSLFNLKEDRTEMNNLADKYPKQYKKMLDTYKRMYIEKEAHIYNEGKNLRWYVSPADYTK